MKVLLIAPTSNELEAVKIILPKIDKKNIDEILIVDYNSTDGTVEYCEEKGFRVHRQKSKGYGAAIQEALKLNHNDIIVEFPPDGSSPPEHIQELIEKIKDGNDLAIGSRYLPGAKSYDDDVVTAFGNWMFTFIVNFLFGTKFSDVLIGYRAYRRSMIDKLNIRAKSLDWSVELPILFAKAGAKITEIPSDEPKRIGGQRKMHPIGTGIEISKVIIREFLQYNNYLKKKNLYKKS